MSTISSFGSISGFGGYDFGSVGGPSDVGDVGSVGGADGIGGAGDAGDSASMGGDSSLVGGKGEASEITLADATNITPPEVSSDPLQGLFPDTPSPTPADTPAPDKGPLNITDAGRALADKFGTSQAWEMTKAMRDDPNGNPDMRQQVTDTLGREPSPEELRDLEHYLYAASDVGDTRGVAARAAEAAKMATMTAGYSALKAVAQHTGNTELEQNAAQYWSQAADNVPTDGSALHAAEYIGAKIMEKVVSPIDIRNALGMGSNVNSSRATVSEFLSGLSGTVDGLFRGKK